MPVWHEATRALQADGSVAMVGIVQEQRPGRARLFMQWKQMDWPIMVDALNELGVAVVPITMFIDEHGIDLAKSWFYTDSVTDLPLMDIVGHPVATNPDPFLYRTAVKRRWPVRFFDEPS